MDAKPHRPLRPFSALQVHQNENLPLNSTIHKSKNVEVQLGHPQSIVSGTLKGPAKRSAFGDLSNTAAAAAAVNHHISANGGLGKYAVTSTKTAVKMFPHKDDNKENAVKNGTGKDAFLRPAQRPANSQRASSAAVGFPSQPATKQNGARKATVVYNDEQQSKPRSLSCNYRSQPQLRSTEPPVLRRSQSKHVIQETRSKNADEDIDEAPCEYAIREESGEEDAGGPSCMPASGLARPAEMEPPQPVASNPEYEEDSDDGDEEGSYGEQGYTTAHSFKSFGENTTGATTLVAPKRTCETIQELGHASLFVAKNRPQEDIDEEEWDMSMVAEYGEEIFMYMRVLEERMLPNPHYMEMVQCEIQWSMRSILMDWLVQVHNRFALLPETLFLTVNYIDRFLSNKMVSLGKLQLVGATAIFVAAKYEEINCPSVQEIVYMVDEGYTVDEILKAERFMLSMLQFELGWPGPMSFLRRISKADDYDLETRTLAKYFLEVTIMDERFVGCVPSYLAAGAHCLARLILKKGEWVSFDPLFGLDVDNLNLKLKSLWSLAHIHYSGYTWAQLKPLVAMMLDCCRSPQKHHLSVYEKYRDRRFKKSSIFVETEIANGFTLPFENSIPRASLFSKSDDQSAPIRFPPPESSGLPTSTES